MSPRNILTSSCARLGSGMSATLRAFSGSHQQDVFVHNAPKLGVESNEFKHQVAFVGIGVGPIDWLAAITAMARRRKEGEGREGARGRAGGGGSR